jgi:hypothetical protein
MSAEKEAERYVRDGIPPFVDVYAFGAVGRVPRSAQPI